MTYGKWIMSAALATGLATASASASTIITQWNFNGDSATTVPGGTSSPTPSIGTGTASLVGGVTATFASGTASGGSSDPVTASPPNFGWNTTTYAAQGQENLQRGVAFAVSTLGYENIQFSFDTRHSNTAANTLRVQYSTDGGATFVNSSQFTANAGDTWFNNRSVDLSAVTALNDNPNVVFRVVAEFGNATAYVASNPSSTYGPTGTLRYDMVTISGTVIPEPTSLTLLGLGGLGLLARRRKA